MGCFSSKILKQPGNFQEQLNKRIKRRSNGLQEPLISKNGRQSLGFLNCTRNPAAKTSELYEVPGTHSNADVEHTDVKLIDSKKLKIHSKSLGTEGAETINAWELLAGLEEETEIEGNQQERTEKNSRVHTTEPTYHKFRVSAKDYSPSANFKSTLEKNEGRVVHTVEEYDAFLATHKLQEENKDAIENTQSQRVQTPQECSIFAHKEKEQGIEADKGEHEDACKKIETNRLLLNLSERKTVEHNLSASEAPSLNFSRSGSLRDWLLGGNQSTSPPEQTGSCPTVFYPEMVAQFEQAMEQLMMDEDFILQQILER